MHAVVATGSGGEDRVSVRPGYFADIRWQLGELRNTDKSVTHALKKGKLMKARRLYYEDIVKRFHRFNKQWLPWKCSSASAAKRQSGISEMPLGFNAMVPKNTRHAKTRRKWKKPG